MMKRKFLAIVLPIVGCATLVGSGFSAWYFGAQVGTATDNWKGNIHVTDPVNDNNGVISLVKAEENTLLDGDYILLDQGITEVEDPYYLERGIGFYTPDEGGAIKNAVEAVNKKYAIKANYTNDLTLKGLYDNKMQIVITIEISVNKTLDNYINLDTSKKATIESTVDTFDGLQGFESSVTDVEGFNVYTIKYVPDISTTAEKNVDWTLSLDLSTDIDKKNKLFSYENNKPKSNSELRAMKSALTSVGEDALIKIDSGIAVVNR